MAEDENRVKRLEFRRMLLKLSDRLSTDNLEDLKHLLIDEIPKVKLESVRQGTSLFEALEEKNLINSDKLGYLKEILSAIDRNDLCELVGLYEESGSIVTAQSKILSETDLSHVNLMAIGKEVGKDWKMLARHLNLPESEIQQIHAANIMDLHEASLQALLRWRDLQGEKATVRALKQALKDMRLMGIVHKYFDS